MIILNNFGDSHFTRGVEVYDAPYIYYYEENSPTKIERSFQDKSDLERNFNTHKNLIELKTKEVK